METLVIWDAISLIMTSLQCEVVVCRTIATLPMKQSWKENVDGLVKDCSNPSTLAMELLQSGT